MCVCCVGDNGANIADAHHQARAAALPPHPSPSLFLANSYPDIFFNALEFAAVLGVLVLFGVMPGATTWSGGYALLQTPSSTPPMVRPLSHAYIQYISKNVCIKLCHQFGLENGRGVAPHQPVCSLHTYTTHDTSSRIRNSKT